mmetsp:Transcript_31763/g.53056  ORF Transcript_31763/g.53056 Transcript_31763/m.53056 type:complete len:227 (-) Transcript_31763:131-811(-)
MDDTVFLGLFHVNLWRRRWEKTKSLSRHCARRSRHSCRNGCNGIIDVLRFCVSPFRSCRMLASPRIIVVCGTSTRLVCSNCSSFLIVVGNFPASILSRPVRFVVFIPCVTITTSVARASIRRFGQRRYSFFVTHSPWLCIVSYSFASVVFLIFLDQLVNFHQLHDSLKARREVFGTYVCRSECLLVVVTHNAGHKKTTRRKDLRHNRSSSTLYNTASPKVSQLKHQ